MKQAPNGGYFCNTQCMTTYAFKNKEKGKQIKHRAQKKQLKDNDRSLRMREAQKAFNAFIRARDKGKPCISCGYMPNFSDHIGGSGIQAGHYKSRGSSPELAYEELNCHVQCYKCNVHLSGNIKGYRPALIEKIGLDKVEWLEGPHKAKKYTCDQLKEIELKYKAKIKELENESI